MTVTASRAAPAYAIRVWTDGLGLYAEIPGSPSYVMRFDLTDSGLSKALDLLRVRQREAPVGSHSVPDRLITRVVGKTTVPMTQAMRDNARDVLRKLGMI